MIFNSEDFLQLEFMDIPDLRQAIDVAKEYIEEVENTYEELENECFFKPSLSILFVQLNNIEGYIIKAESLIDEKLGEIILSKKIIKRRKKLQLLSI